MTYRVSPLGDFAVLGQKSFDQKFAGLEIDHHFAGTARNVDKRGYALVQDLLAGKHALLRDGIV